MKLEELNWAHRRTAPTLASTGPTAETVGNSRAPSLPKSSSSRPPFAPRAIEIWRERQQHLGME